MGIMKKALLLGLIITLAGFLPTFAAVTPEQTTDAEYIINSGYSQAMAEEVFVNKNRNVGAPIEPLYEKSQNRFVRAWRTFYAYIDPAVENVDKIHHDIKQSPHYLDL